MQSDNDREISKNDKRCQAKKCLEPQIEWIQRKNTPKHLLVKLVRSSSCFMEGSQPLLVTCMYVWMVIIYTYMTVAECICESVIRFTVCICAHVPVCLQMTVWIYTSDDVPVFKWKCKHIMCVHDYEWMYPLYLCFSTFVFQ